MKKALSVGIIVLLAVGASFMVYASNVSNTQHNMLKGFSAAGTTEVCVFCHTPHNAQSEAPLWNHTNQSLALNYTIYGNPFGSMQGTTTQPAGVSRACLSCHDGTVAVDSVSNPSPNAYNQLSDNTISGSWLTLGGDGARINNSSSALLGTALTDDHPISMNYLPGVLPAGDPDLQPNTLATVVGNWTGYTLPLFVNGVNYTVECASCHNVHDDTNTPFLREDNQSSYLCLTCHNK